MADHCSGAETFEVNSAAGNPALMQSVAARAAAHRTNSGRSTELPPIHRNACDRFLIATAQLAGLRLATPDETIRQYPGLGVIW